MFFFFYKLYEWIRHRTNEMLSMIIQGICPSLLWPHWSAPSSLLEDDGQTSCFVSLWVMVRVPTLPSVSPAEGLTAAPRHCSVTFPFALFMVCVFGLCPWMSCLLETLVLPHGSTEPCSCYSSTLPMYFLAFVFWNKTNHFAPWQLWQDSRIEVLTTTVLFSDAPALTRGDPSYAVCSEVSSFSLSEVC